MPVDTSTCQQIQCGALTQEQAGVDLLMQCSMAGYAGSRNCSDPVCKPFVPQILRGTSGQALQCRAQVPVAITDVKKIYVPAPSGPVAAVMPRAVDAALPDLVAQSRGNALAQGELPRSAVLNPRALLNPLPQIVPEPMDLAGPQVCSAFASWVSANPVLAALGLVAAYLLVTKK